jgi:vancomycin resistance protein YoaR
MKKLSKKMRLRLKVAVGMIVIIFSIIAAAVLFANVAYGEKIYPKVTIAGMNLGGKTKSEAQEIINQKVTEYLEKEPVFILKNNQRTWRPLFSELGGGILINETIDDAFRIGHQENFFISALRQIQSIFVPINVDLKIDYNKIDYDHCMKPIREKLETPYQNDSWRFDGLNLVEIAAKEGKAIDEKDMKAQINQYVQRFDQGEIKIVIRKSYPKVRRENSYEAKATAEKMVSAPISLVYLPKKYLVTQETIASWVVFAEKQTDNAETDLFSPYVSDHFKLEAKLSDKAIKEYARSFADDINKAPVNARLQFVNGKLRILQKSIPGVIVDEQQLVNDINAIVLQEDGREVEIHTSKLSSEINEKNLSKLGIKELLSTGISDFSGSPNNRRHNIAVGASMFNGIIIKPGDEFSFTTTLGEVSAKTGYLPELVIKEDKTIPEYGGGLCQVSTTTFRAAVLAGLPILEREPHSYRVKYYDWPYGPGFDSTVYIPHPDLRFRNDTSAHILIQTYVSGSRLYFEFYGTKGKRSVKIEGPRVLKWLSGGALKTEMYQLVYEGKKLIRKVRFYSFYDRPDKYHTNTTKPKTETKPKTTTKKKTTPTPEPEPEPEPIPEPVPEPETP